MSDNRVAVADLSGNSAKTPHVVPENSMHCYTLFVLQPTTTKRWKKINLKKQKLEDLMPKIKS